LLRVAQSIATLGANLKRSQAREQERGEREEANHKVKINAMNAKTCFPRFCFEERMSPFRCPQRMSLFKPFCSLTQKIRVSCLALQQREWGGSENENSSQDHKNWQL
jgi:hypothetical protein